jgi:hemoglobin
MKPDITNRNDIEKLMMVFYTKARSDERIAFFFNDLVQINWETHLPRIVDFWETILFGTGTYKGEPMTAHFQLSKLHKIEEKHFAAWLELFLATTDELFAGEKATEIKTRAKSIAGIMQVKLA